MQTYIPHLRGTPHSRTLSPILIVVAVIHSHGLVHVIRRVITISSSQIRGEYQINLMQNRRVQIITT